MCCRKDNVQEIVKVEKQDKNTRFRMVLYFFTLYIWFVVRLPKRLPVWPVYESTSGTIFSTISTRIPRNYQSSLLLQYSRFFVCRKSVDFRAIFTHFWPLKNMSFKGLFSWMGIVFEDKNETKVNLDPKLILTDWCKLKECDFRCYILYNGK